jgi:CheY-like chemotaxis protein
VQILVVDDEPGVRLLVCRMLAQGGYGTCEAADGAEALAPISPTLHLARCWQALQPDYMLTGRNIGLCGTSHPSLQWDPSSFRR